MVKGKGFHFFSESPSSDYSVLSYFYHFCFHIQLLINVRIKAINFCMHFKQKETYKKVYNL